MRGLILLAALVCVAAYSPSKAVEPECVEPRSTCATQQTAANKHFQEMAIAAANHMGLCTATEADTRNNDGGATPAKILEPATPASYPMKEGEVVAPALIKNRG